MNLTFSGLERYENNLNEAIGLLDREHVTKHILRKDYALWSSQLGELVSKQVRRWVIES
jgi:hypothetical protein